MRTAYIQLFIRSFVHSSIHSVIEFNVQLLAISQFVRPPFTMYKASQQDTKQQWGLGSSRRSQARGKVFLSFFTVLLTSPVLQTIMFILLGAIGKFNIQRGSDCRHQIAYTCIALWDNWQKFNLPLTWHDFTYPSSHSLSSFLFIQPLFWMERCTICLYHL